MATIGVGLSREQAASVSLAPSVSDLTTEERQRVNRSVGSELDTKLANQLRVSFGATLTVGQLVALTGALKHSIRSSLGNQLGIGGSTGVGASASAGVSLGGGGGIQGATSLGASMGARPGPGAGAQTLAGVTLGGGIAATSVAGLTAGLEGSATANSRIRLSASADLKVAIGAILSTALLGSGLSAEKAASVQAEIGPALNASLDESFQSAFGPSPGFPHAAGTLVLGSEVTMPLVGAWQATVEADTGEDEAPPTGPYWFEVDGVEFRGTVLPARAGAFGGRVKIKVVGGAGGLSAELKPRNYAAGVTRVSTVVGDIVRDTGETLSGESDQAILDKQIPAWQRAAGAGKDALTKVLEKVGATWRVLRDGTIWIGVDTWPEVEPDGHAIEEDWGDGLVTWAPDHPTMVPGVVVRGQRVEQVVHRLERAGLRTELHARSLQSSLRKALGSQRNDTDYTKRWRCRVTRQNSNGTVDVLIDDERMRARGVGQCRVRVGLPGTTLEVPKGARCLVGWDDADPALPYASDWESGTVASTAVITYPGGTRPAAGLGSMVRVILPFAPLPAPGPPVPFAVFGFVETGNEQNLI